MSHDPQSLLTVNCQLLRVSSQAWRRWHMLSRNPRLGPHLGSRLPTSVHFHVNWWLHSCGAGKAADFEVHTPCVRRALSADSIPRTHCVIVSLSYYSPQSCSSLNLAKKGDDLTGLAGSGHHHPPPGFFLFSHPALNTQAFTDSVPPLRTALCFAARLVSVLCSCVGHVTFSLHRRTHCP